jgi:hypothetical protein
VRSRPPAILYLDSYTLDAADGGQVPSSMSIGYGVTAGRVIREFLLQHGFRLIRPLADTEPYGDGSRGSRLRWVLRGYERIVDAVLTEWPDLVFFFHSFNAFPAEVLRILIETGSKIPMVGYTHGSHWDPSDGERKTKYPGLELLDLANLAALDQILFDSEFMKSTVIRNVRTYNSDTADELAGKSHVVGLPIDTEFIDSHRSDQRFPRTTVVFNHAPVAAKNPVEFIRVIERIMPKYDIDVLFTRAFGRGAAGAPEIERLRGRFGERVIVGNNMSLANYFRALWMSDIQVSTAFHESLGIATLEAMYTENCCLLPFRGSYPEISGANSEVLYRGSAELERKLAFFIEHPERRRAAGLVLADRARLYGVATIGPRIVDAIAETLRGANPDRVWPDRRMLPSARRSLSLSDGG